MPIEIDADSWFDEQWYEDDVIERQIEDSEIEYKARQGELLQTWRGVVSNLANAVGIQSISDESILAFLNSADFFNIFNYEKTPNISIVGWPSQSEIDYAHNVDLFGERLLALVPVFAPLFYEIETDSQMRN